MRPPSKIATAIVSAWIGIHVNPAVAQSFQERWSIIPKAHAEQPSPTSPEIGSDPQAKSPVGTEPARGSEVRLDIRSSKRSFSGKASFYSYRTGKTASGF